MYETIVKKYKKSVIVLLIIGIISTASSLTGKIELAYESYMKGYYSKNNK